MEVPIQCGDEEQRFWDSHSSAFEALGQTHCPQEISQAWEQSPSPAPLCSSAPRAAAPSVTPCPYSPWLTSHQSHPGAGAAFPLPPLPGTSFPTGGMNCSVAVPSHNPGCLSKGDKSSPTIGSFQKQTSLVTFHARKVMNACLGLQSCRSQLRDIEEVIANSSGKGSCCFHVWRLHSECQLSQHHICQPHPVSKQGWANSTGHTWLWQSPVPGFGRSD